MKHLMDANDDNSLVGTCDLFDIEQYNKERKNTYKWLNPATFLCLFPNHDQVKPDYKIVIFCCFSIKHAVFWSKSKDWFSQNQVYESK
jgi:hypothetical protein